MNETLQKQILIAQKTELTEYHIYKKLADLVENENDRNVLRRIAEDEYKHYLFWGKQSGKEVMPSKGFIFFYIGMARIFGLNFAIQLMEKTEKLAQRNYDELKTFSPEVENIMRDEERHEEELLSMLSQEELKYTGSIILGMNDALVELTGVLAGLTLVFKNANLVAAAAFITGIAASLSMAASEYLSKKDEGEKKPLKASIYTGIAYIIVVALLISPYLVFDAIYWSLAISLFFALLVILVFNFYASVAKNMPFKKRFIEMASISLGVATLNFIIGLFVREYFGIEV